MSKCDVYFLAAQPQPPFFTLRERLLRLILRLPPTMVRELTIPRDGSCETSYWA
jgi:hypothetical protein